MEVDRDYRKYRAKLANQLNENMVTHC
jgi:hypothetical protein